MKYCLICKREDFEEQEMEETVHIVCTSCGFVHVFHHDYYDHSLVEEAQGKEQERNDELDSMHQTWLDEE